MVLALKDKLISRMHALNRTESLAIHGRNILLVIAHPDDEVMFFGPTLIGITNSSAENSVRVLCLSNGVCIVPQREAEYRECRGNWTDQGGGIN